MNVRSVAAEDRISKLMLGIALLSAAVLVLPGLATSPLGIDEHVSYWIAGSENPGTIWERSLNYAATPPLSSYVQRAFLGLCGKSIFWFRLPSVIGFWAAIAFTYLFARDLLGPLPGGLAAMLLVWHPDALDRMRQARPYGLTLGLAALLLWLTLRWSRSPRRISHMAAWTMAAVALVWTHYLNLPLVGLMMIWLFGFRALRSEGQQRPGRLLLLALILFGVCIAPVGPSLLRLQAWAEFLNFRQAPPPVWKGVNPFWWLLLPVGMSFGWLLTRVIPGKIVTLPLSGHLPLLILIGCLPVVGFAVFPAGSLAALSETRYRLAYAPASVVLLAGCLLQHRNLVAAVLASAIGVAGAWWMMGERPWNSIELTVPAATDWTRLTERLQREGAPFEPLYVYSGIIESRLVPVLFEDPRFHDYVACRAGRFIIEAAHPRHALPWSWNRHAPLIAYYEGTLQQAMKRGLTRAWLIASIDTDLGRDAIERFSELAKTQRYRETDRTSLSNAVLIRFERFE